MTKVWERKQEKKERDDSAESREMERMAKAGNVRQKG